MRWWLHLSEYDFGEQQRQYAETLQLIEIENRQRSEELRKLYELLKNQLDGY
jgi:hypothetical protein